jgi:hypothetical protein
MGDFGSISGRFRLPIIVARLFEMILVDGMDNIFHRFQYSKCDQTFDH